MIVCAGLTVPSAFETRVKGNQFGLGAEEFLVFGQNKISVVVHGRDLKIAPRSWHNICQGTMFEWCSIAVMRISSPGPIRERP